MHRFVLTFLSTAGLIVWAQEPTAIHVRNFGKVNDHLYRGGEPRLAGLEELSAIGVKLDVDLCQPGERGEEEAAAAQRLGIRYINIPFSEFAAPSDRSMERVLSLLTADDANPVFLHCRRGKDRTGTVIACYRVQHDHWENRRALSEAKQYGMSAAERGMRTYVLHFHPLSAAPSISPVP